MHDAGRSRNHLITTLSAENPKTGWIKKISTPTNHSAGKNWSKCRWVARRGAVCADNQAHKGAYLNSSRTSRYWVPRIEWSHYAYNDWPGKNRSRTGYFNEVIQDRATSPASESCCDSLRRWCPRRRWTSNLFLKALRKSWFQRV